MLTFLLACAHHIPEPDTAATAFPAAPPRPAPPAPPTLPQTEGMIVDPPRPVAPPARTTVCRVDFQTGTLPHGLVAAHGAVKEDVPSVASGLLLLNPAGDWLVDGGLADDALAHISEVKGFVGFAMKQSAKDWTRLASPADAVRAQGTDPTQLAGLVPSHGHYDHLGGLVDLPDIPIWLPAAELANAQAAVDGGKSSVLPAEAAGLLPRAKELVFDGPAFGPYPASKDLYGDGSVVFVPMPGHTLGSVGTFVRLASGKRIFHVGDTVWVREGYEQREPKSFIAGAFDADAAQTELQIQRLWQLHRADPDLLILPAHDARQWDLAFGEDGCLQ